MSSKDWIGYPALVDNAYRTIVRDTLRHVAKGGTMGNHHFMITFDTHAPGVVLSDVMRERFPDVITIVLQHQFWDLKVQDDAFEVGLSFNKMPEILRVPYTAIRQFADPSQNFGFTVRAPDGEVRIQRAPAPAIKAEPQQPDAPQAASTEATAPGEKPPADQTVVSLDKFRKK